MKYVLTGENNVIIAISDTLGEQSNGNPLVTDKEGNQYAIAKYLIKNKYEIEEIPENVMENKYCYNVEQGFYKNSDWKEYYSEEQRISALEDTVNMLLGF